MKSKQELIEEWESAIEAAEFYGKGKEERLISYMKDFVSDLNQLDEPERIEETTHLLESVLKENKRLGNLLEEKHEEWLDLMDIINNRETETLSPKWVDDNSVYASSDGVTEEYVHVDDLQNLLVPKQEEVDRAYKDGYEKGKQHTFYKGYLEGLTEGERKTNEYFESITEEPSYEQVQKYLSEHGIEVVGKEPETVADVMADFFKSLERLKEVMSMEVEGLEE